MSQEEPKFLVKRLSPNAYLPVRSSEHAAGYDLASAVDTTVPKHGRQLVATDLALAIPHGYYGRVAPRSGLALKHFIDTGAGVIDSDYRGNLGVLLFNHADVDFEIKKGDRIAQLILEKIILPPVVEIGEHESLDVTARQEGGFGSTGVTSPKD
jgi:dUTP pyrophosphatase